MPVAPGCLTAFRSILPSAALSCAIVRPFLSVESQPRAEHRQFRDHE
jgi:hypothetical protein